MDYDKLIEQLNAWNEQHLSVVCGSKHFACDYLCENEDCIVVRAATALSTLQAENEKLKRALAEMWFAYVNKDGEIPHTHEEEAVELAQEILGPWGECMPKYLRRGSKKED